MSCKDPAGRTRGQERKGIEKGLKSKPRSLPFPSPGVIRRSWARPTTRHCRGGCPSAMCPSRGLRGIRGTIRRDDMASDAVRKAWRPSGHDAMKGRRTYSEIFVGHSIRRERPDEEEGYEGAQDGKAYMRINRRRNLRSQYEFPPQVKRDEWTYRCRPRRVQYCPSGCPLRQMLSDTEQHKERNGLDIAIANNRMETVPSIMGGKARQNTDSISV